ncbi:hypothetical protein RRF57_001808 [Xylaria bambusicola]|uniref:Uncharacterized protein n=1 Tax=Xylaria bambusicola TaxID=326684 RepID=A0AAN7Z3X1_9PEZI
MEHQKLVERATTVNTPESAESQHSDSSRVPDNNMTLATSQSIEISTVSDALSSVTTGPGEASCSKSQMEVNRCNDEIDPVSPALGSEGCTHTPRTHGMTRSVIPENTDTHHTQSSQTSDSDSSQHLERTTRTVDGLPDSHSYESFSIYSTMPSEIDSRSYPEEESLFVSETDEMDPSRPSQSQASEDSGEALLGPVMEFMGQYTPQWHRKNGHTEPSTFQAGNSSNKRFSPSPNRPLNTKGVAKDSDSTVPSTLESTREPEVEEIAVKKMGPRSKTAREWFGKKYSQQELLRVTDAKRKRDAVTDDAGTSHHKRQKQRKSVTKKGSNKNSGKNGKSMQVMHAMFESLRSNPIEARIAHGDLPEADPIKANTKADQLEQLLRALPQNANERSVSKDKRTLQEATCSFGYNNCAARDGKWLVKGMKTTLHPHQVIGASWMLDREFGIDGPRGGILADEMGMGKTLETIACIVSNQPSDDDLKIYYPTTLVVAPATAIEQWESEIKTHVSEDYIQGILHYKESKKLPIVALKNMDIILVSYQELCRQLPSKKFIARLEEECQESPDLFDEKYNERLGALFKINFWRIVLDESHNIKNNNSQTCQQLIGRYRWALSGTPITNSIDEIYPYLKFLKAEVPDEMKAFRAIFLNTEDSTAMERLQRMIRPIMLRRTMKDTFMGRPLYEIPKPHYDVKVVKLTKEERIIYSTVERRFRDIINELLESGGLEHLNLYLVLLLRLRQGVTHPFLLETTMKKVLTQEDLRDIQSRIRDMGVQQPIFKRIGEWCAQRWTSLTAGGNDKDPGIAFGNSQFGYGFNMNKQMTIALEAHQEDVCRICYQEPVDPQIGQCKHAFCAKCLSDHIKDEYQNGRIVPKCFECNKPLVDYEPLLPSDAEGSDKEDMTNTASGITIFRRRLGRDIFKKHPKLRKSQSMFLRQSDKAYPESVLASAKTTAVKATILEWQSQAPEDKIIVFMEFKMTGAILGRMLEAESIPFLYFFGDMDSTAKDQAIRAFREKNEIKVMIASIHCGSVALNMTIANRVIMVDLWWNLAIELQAFGRVFRIGQAKETHFRRIVADNTIDNRLVALQEEKEENISKIMESGGKRKLSLRETLSLFGRVEESDGGNLQVLSDVEEGADSIDTERGWDEDEEEESDNVDEPDETWDI